jgi:hypothetical protein
MATLRTVLPGTGYSLRSDQGIDTSEPRPVRDNDDDDASRSHRQLIGWIGLLMPLLLWVLAGVRPNDAASAWTPLDSISAYFYSSAAFVFVGLLAALSLYLFAYRGFRNNLQVWDKRVARTAASAALVVVAFPTFAPSATLRVPWWMDWFATAHYASAALLFACFAVFSLFLFTRRHPNMPDAPDKAWRNAVYYLCGFAILASMAWAAVQGFNHRPLLWPESVALFAFAASWLVKGAVHKTMAEKARSLRTRSTAPSS